MIKKILAKYLSQVLLVATIVGLGYFAYTLWRDSRNQERQFQELIGTKEKYEQLTKYTAKLESDYKVQKDLAAQADAKWKEVVRQKDEKIQMLSDATYLIGRYVNKTDGPDYYFETKGRTRNYIYNEVRLEGPDSPPIGFVMIKNDGRTYKGNYGFEIRVETMTVRDETTGQYRVFSKAFLVSKENGLADKRRPDFKKWAGIPYPLTIVGGTALIDPTLPSTNPKRFLLWAPHLNGGLNLGADVNGPFLRPGLNFSFSGYGRSRNDLDWKFLQLGIGTDTSMKNPDLHFIPFTYRPMPSFFTNTYVGPGVQWSKDGVGYFINTSVGF